MLRSGTENNLTHIFLVLATAGLGHRVYRKLYTSIGGQRAEKFESHWSILSGALSVHSSSTRMKARCQASCNVGVVFKNQQLQDFSTGGFGPAWGHDQKPLLNSSAVILQNPRVTILIIRQLHLNLWFSLRRHRPPL